VDALRTRFSASSQVLSAINVALLKRSRLRGTVSTVTVQLTKVGRIVNSCSMKSRSVSALSVIDQDLSRHGNKRYYTIPELTKLTGLTRRQLDYWAVKKLITPTLRYPRIRGGKPSTFYSPTEALKILIFSDVKRRGFSLIQIRQLQRNFVSNLIKLDEVGTYLLTDGVTIFYAKRDTEVIDILKNNRQMLLVPIRDQIERLRSVA
jgi:DNA-binding transcriptional MerR regulator